jgi:hypothetical protein
MAPFCSPLVEGKLVEQRRYQTNTFKPPYIKDKRAPDLRKPVRRQIGERIGGNLTGAEREQANLFMEMSDQVDILNRRMEWMAAQALVSGSYTVSGEGFPSTNIDFGRDAALTVTLAGNYMWDSGNAAATPQQNIDLWGNLLVKKSGAPADTIIFTPTPWNYFIADPNVQKQIYLDTNNARYAKNDIQGATETKFGAIYKGRWGSYELYVYNDWYVDDTTNVETRMIPDGTIVMSSENLLGTRAFGQIMDPEFNYTAMAYAPKTWIQKDPAQRFLLMQSAPLIIPSRVNASFAATVTNAVQS